MQVKVSGLGIIFCNDYKSSPEWKNVPCRRKTKWLRERYWANRAERNPDRGFISISVHSEIDREVIGRRQIDPGDSFHLRIYGSHLETGGSITRGNKWAEVTEVYTTTDPSDIESIMRLYHGLQTGGVNEVEDFVKHLYMGRPTVTEQIRAAECVVDAIKKKIGKESYRDLPQKVGYGTLVVGLPLWFACPPVNPFRIENVVDNFPTRIACAFREEVRNELKQSGCPFDSVVVAWDVTMTALEEWWREASTRYSDFGGHTIADPFTTGEILEAVFATDIEDDMQGMAMWLNCRVKKLTPSGQIAFPIEKLFDSIVQNRDRLENRPKVEQFLAVISSHLRWERLRWNVLKRLNLIRRQSNFCTMLKWIKLYFKSRWIARQQRRLYRQSAGGGA